MERVAFDSSLEKGFRGMFGSKGKRVATSTRSSNQPNEPLDKPSTDHDVKSHPIHGSSEDDERIIITESIRDGHRVVDQRKISSSQILRKLPLNGDGKSRYVFRIWPSTETEVDVEGLDLPPGKMTPNGFPKWGETLFNFYHFIQGYGWASRVSSSIAAAWSKTAQAENEDIKRELEFEKLEQDPKVIEPCDVSLLIKDADIEAPRSTINIDGDVISSSWQFEVPFSKPAPTLQKRLPLYLLPEILYVDDPCGVLAAKDPSPETDEDGSHENPYADPFIATHGQTYVYRLCHLTDDAKDIMNKQREEAKERYREQVEEAKSSRLLFSYDGNGPVPPAFQVPKPPPPPPHLSIREARMSITPAERIGEGHHSYAYNVELELPRSLFFQPEVCTSCVVEDVERVMNEEEHALWSQFDDMIIDEDGPYLLDPLTNNILEEPEGNPLPGSDGAEGKDECEEAGAADESQSQLGKDNESEDGTSASQEEVTGAHDERRSDSHELDETEDNVQQSEDDGYDVDESVVGSDFYKGGGGHGVRWRGLDPHIDQFGRLPQGWERRITVQGRICYLNTETGNITWERPPTTETNFPPIVGLVTQRPKDNASESTGDDQVPVGESDEIEKDDRHEDDDGWKAEESTVDKDSIGEEGDESGNADDPLAPTDQNSEPLEELEPPALFLPEPVNPEDLLLPRPLPTAEQKLVASTNQQQEESVVRTAPEKLFEAKHRTLSASAEGRITGRITRRVLRPEGTIAVTRTLYELTEEEQRIVLDPRDIPGYGQRVRLGSYVEIDHRVPPSSFPTSCFSPEDRPFAWGDMSFRHEVTRQSVVSYMKSEKGNEVVVEAYPVIAKPAYMYQGPARFYPTVSVKYQYTNSTDDRGPCCKHLFPPKLYLPRTSVRVVAKISKEGDQHLEREAKNYQLFPQHMFEHWSGYNQVPPLTDPVPVGPVVPQYYGYYKPAGNKQMEGRYLSPILLLENCGVPVDVNKLNADDRYVNIRLSTTCGTFYD